MLASADAALAERDQAIPGLATVLDPAALVGRLVSAGHEVEGAHPTYLRYKPGTACVVGYRFLTARGAVLGYAKAVSDAARPKLEKLASKAGAVVLDPDHVGVALFPRDRALPALPRLVDDRLRPALLSRVLPNRPDLWQAALEPLRYKPERRFVGALTVDGHRVAVVRLHDEASFAAASEATGALARCMEPPVPRRLGHSKTDRVLVLSWLEGTSLVAALSDPRGAEQVAAAGAAVGTLHTCRCRGLPKLAGEDEVVPLLAAVDAIAGIAPSRAERAHRLAGSLAPRLAPPRKLLTTHGDLSADQVIIGPGGAGLVDLDRAVAADPASDLASFTADLHLRTVTGGLDSDRVPELVTCLLDGYATTGWPRAAERLPASTAAWLLRRAHEPFRARLRGWDAALDHILDLAQEVAG